jgi:UDP-2,3-diacylglucosamine pyrophosphatase LpxH
MANATLFPSPQHTVVVSDIHLTTAEPKNAKDPLWRRYKQRDFFIDRAFCGFLSHILEKTAGLGQVELVLAGDIFDFDGVTQIPPGRNYSVSPLERLRGLHPEEPKSCEKMRLIIEDHPEFFDGLARFVKEGNLAVFIIGNHDLELHWPSVQRLVLDALALPPEDEVRVTFNNWFLISGGDTLIEHGNQHDSHSNGQNPVNPRIRGLKHDRIRLPFGCYANRLMINGMGYFNPHSERTFRMSTVEYIKFAFGHLLRKEPLLIWTWFWGACATVMFTAKETITPEVKDPLLVEEQIEEIAKLARTSPRVVRTLKEVHCPPMLFDPLSLLRELWLDRAFMVLFGAFMAYQTVAAMNLIGRVSYWWMFAIFALFLPFFIFYFASIKPKVNVDVKHYEKALQLIAQICGVKRVVFGHTHEFVHKSIGNVEYLNSGTWSPAFDDIACTRPSCPKTFVWIRPDNTVAAADGDQAGRAPQPRIANVFEWTPEGQSRLLC